MNDAAAILLVLFFAVDIACLVALTCSKLRKVDDLAQSDEQTEEAYGTADAEEYEER